jgi:hypothetical protein
MPCHRSKIIYCVAVDASICFRQEARLAWDGREADDEIAHLPPAATANACAPRRHPYIFARTQDPRHRPPTFSSSSAQAEEAAEVRTISPFHLTFWLSLAPLGSLVRRLVIGLRLTEFANVSLLSHKIGFSRLSPRETLCIPVF